MAKASLVVESGSEPKSPPTAAVPSRGSIKGMALKCSSSCSACSIVRFLTEKPNVHPNHRGQMEVLPDDTTAGCARMATAAVAPSRAWACTAWYSLAFADASASHNTVPRVAEPAALNRPSITTTSWCAIGCILTAFARGEGKDRQPSDVCKRHTHTPSVIRHLQQLVVQRAGACGFPELPGHAQPAEVVDELLLPRHDPLLFHVLPSLRDGRMKRTATHQHRDKSCESYGRLDDAAPRALRQRERWQRLDEDSSTPWSIVSWERQDSTAPDARTRAIMYGDYTPACQ